MPILFLGKGHDEAPHLVCINKHSEALTMVKMTEEVGLTILPEFTLALRCRIFTCTVCNYVELYLAQDPA